MQASPKIEFPSARQVLDCIEEWRQFDLRKATNDEVDRSLDRLIKRIGQQLLVKVTKKPSKLWRIRKFKKLLREEKEFWEPPSKDAKAGRCNAAESPVLYVSEQLRTPFEECSIKPEDVVYLIKYKAKRSLKLCNVVGQRKLDKDLLDENSQVSYEILREFIRSEFMKPVGKGTEYLYKLSAAVCRTLANIESADGWIYPSVAFPAELNIALKGTIARKVMAISDVRIVKLAEGEEAVRSGKIPSAALPVFNKLRMAIFSEYKAIFREDGVGWTPCSDIGGFF